MGRSKKISNKDWELVGFRAENWEGLDFSDEFIGVGRRYALFGMNNSGKSSFVRLLAVIDKITEDIPWKREKLRPVDGRSLSKEEELKQASRPAFNLPIWTTTRVRAEEDESEDENTEAGEDGDAADKDDAAGPFVGSNCINPPAFLLELAFVHKQLGRARFCLGFRLSEDGCYRSEIEELKMEQDGGSLEVRFEDIISPPYVTIHRLVIRACNFTADFTPPSGKDYEWYIPDRFNLHSIVGNTVRAMERIGRGKKRPGHLPEEIRNALPKPGHFESNECDLIIIEVFQPYGGPRPSPPFDNIIAFSVSTSKILGLETAAHQRRLDELFADNRRNLAAFAFLIDMIEYSESRIRSRNCAQAASLQGEKEFVEDLIGSFIEEDAALSSQVSTSVKDFIVQALREGWIHHGWSDSSANPYTEKPCDDQHSAEAALLYFANLFCPPINSCGIPAYQPADHVLEDLTWDVAKKTIIASGRSSTESLLEGGWLELENLRPQSASVEIEGRSFPTLAFEAGYKGPNWDTEERGIAPNEIGKGVTWYLGLLELADSGRQYFEHPEHYLHPKAAADLCEDLILRTPFTVIETHSEAMLLRLQRMVARKQIHHRDVHIIITKKVDGVCKVEEIGIQENGDLYLSFPDGFAEYYWGERSS